jgi:hypothetical protein
MRMWTTFRLALLVAAVWHGPAFADEEKMGMSVGNTGATSARPLSTEWLNYWIKANMMAYADQAVTQLASALSQPGPIETDSWSRQTEAEIRSAIANDELLSNNAWSVARCSKGGCIAAIQSLDSRVDKRQGTYKGRLLAYLTPRLSYSHHADLTTVESDLVLVDGKPINRLYLIFFLFRDPSKSSQTIHSARDIRSPGISAAIANEMSAAQAAVAAGSLQEAIDCLVMAEGKEGLTPFDRKSIGELAGYAYIKMHNFKMAQLAYESALDGALEFSKMDASEDMRHILYLSELNQHYLKAVEAGRNLESRAAANAKDMSILSQSYFALQDCKYAILWADQSIAASKSLNESPQNLSLKVKSDCGRFHELAKEAGAADQSLVTH